MLSEWWFWAAAAIVLAIGEVLMPAYVLLGFAIGAAAVALVLIIGGPLAALLVGSVPAMILGYAVLSLIAWLALRKVLGVRRGQVKTFDSDINEN
ncbi:NfeD family protein [Alterinioella nitratireducens]|jgi:membrane protein implicated in regulation of membrane protease activity|uniref:NfeD family protein n=1 Tax=Alterinioella nitratireducens TaxID=2735915 RepID=UPI000C6779AF|nr:hypothetical protein [Alterinioella nitratireducens]MAN14952.1 hypothetical protein [Dinoroseobacter sp.]MAX74579.1 hypothetical protein [Nioella sp.]NPD18829.1 hypothetical protein [Alterinioella nitratireducens]